jgi:putative oxidoreductase
MRELIMNKTFGVGIWRDELILLARIMLMLLFLIFGWKKLTDFAGTVGYFTQLGVPMPGVATAIAVLFELGIGIALMVGLLTRPLAILLSIYILGTGLIGHHFWTMHGMEQFEAEINFFKNISIIGGLILLYLTGAGRYSVDAKIGLP